MHAASTSHEVASPRAEADRLAPAECVGCPEDDNVDSDTADTADAQPLEEAGYGHGV